MYEIGIVLFHAYGYAMPMAKKLTLERLAELTHEELLSLGKRMGEGFQKMEAKMGAGFSRMESGFSAIARELELIQGDIRELKLTRDLISRAVAGEISELRARMARLEKKVGLAK